MQETYDGRPARRQPSGVRSCLVPGFTEFLQIEIFLRDGFNIPGHLLRLLHKGPASMRGIRVYSTFYLQSSTFLEWAMLGSNQRPLPCEGSALPLS